MNKRVHDDSFRKMAIELADSRGFIGEVAEEFGINQSLLSKWNTGNRDLNKIQVGLIREQKLIKKPQNK